MLTLLVQLYDALAGSAVKTRALSKGSQRRMRRVGGLQGDLEARFTVALPGRGRTIMGEWAATVLVQDLPRSAVIASLAYVRPHLVPIAWSTRGPCACRSLQSDMSARSAVQCFLSPTFCADMLSRGCCTAVSTMLRCSAMCSVWRTRSPCAANSLVCAWQPLWQTGPSCQGACVGSQLRGQQVCLPDHRGVYTPL